MFVVHRNKSCFKTSQTVLGNIHLNHSVDGVQKKWAYYADSVDLEVGIILDYADSVDLEVVIILENRERQREGRVLMETSEWPDIMSDESVGVGGFLGIQLSMMLVEVS